MVNKNALIELALCELQETLNTLHKAQEEDRNKLLELSCVAYTSQLIMTRKLGLINDSQYEAMALCILLPNLTVYDAFELECVVIGGVGNE